MLSIGDSSITCIMLLLHHKSPQTIGKVEDVVTKMAVSSMMSSCIFQASNERNMFQRFASNLTTTTKNVDMFRSVL